MVALFRNISSQVGMSDELLRSSRIGIKVDRRVLCFRHDKLNIETANVLVAAKSQT